MFVTFLGRLFLKSCSDLGKMNLFFYLEESEEMISHILTVVQNILWQSFIWSVRGSFERCCRTWSWRASPAHDKKWIIGLFIKLLKPQSALLNRERIKRGVLLKVF